MKNKPIKADIEYKTPIWYFARAVGRKRAKEIFLKQFNILLIFNA